MTRSILVVTLALASAGSSVEAQTSVLFDQAHGQRFLVERDGELDLSDLASVLRSSGLDVETASVPLTLAALEPVRALVISGPFTPLSEEEVSAVVGFVEDGGVLIAMLHIPGPLSALLHRLGVVHSNGVIRELDDVLESEPLNFSVTRLRDHPVTDGLSGFRVYGSWALLPEGNEVDVLAESGPRSWVDLDRDNRLGPGDAVQRFAVAVTGTRGRGRFLVFGDDGMFQNRFLSGPNLDLARNLAGWIVSASGSETVIARRR